MSEKEKIPFVIETDAVTGRLGLTSKALEDFNGKPGLRHLAEQLAKSRYMKNLYAAYPAGQDKFFRPVLQGLGHVVPFAHEIDDVPQRKRLQAARRFSPEAWRGGLEGATFFDERGNPALLLEILQKESASSIALVPDTAFLFDVEGFDRLIEHHFENRVEMSWTFPVAPPGLLGEVYAEGILGLYVQEKTTPRDSLALNLENPRRDPVKSTFAFNTSEKIRQLKCRLTADRAEDLELMRRVSKKIKKEGGRLEDILTEHVNDVPAFPPLLEVELTTKMPAQSKLRPHGQARREDITEELFSRIISEACSQADPIRLSLGGFGDPFETKNPARFLELAQKQGMKDIHVATCLFSFNEEFFEKLSGFDAAVVSVFTDAATPETFKKLWSSGSLENVFENIERALKFSRCSNLFVIPEYVRVVDNGDEFHQFFLKWYPKTKGVLLIGHNDRAGQLERQNPIDLVPTRRFPCRKIEREMLVLSNGVVPECRQDFKAEHPLGDTNSQSLKGIWSGEKATELRKLHLAENWDQNPLCSACREWAALTG